MIRTIAAALVWALTVGLAHATDKYPSETIRIIVPWNTGGPNDLIARALAERMSESLKQPVIIENRPGANGVTGTNAVAKGSKDGHTLLITSSAHSLNSALYKTLPFDSIRDFQPVSLIALTTGSVLVVKQDFPAKTIQEFIAYATKNSGKVSYATNGLGNSTHIVGELLAKAAGINLVPVHYRGTAPFVTDILGGHIQAGVMSPVAAVPLVQDRQMRALATAGNSRTPSLPDVPTFAEAGLPEVNLNSYYGAWFPAGTPRDRAEIMQKAIVEAMQSKEFKRLAVEGDLIVKGSNPAEFSEFIVTDIAQVKAILKRIDLPQFD